MNIKLKKQKDFDLVFSKGNRVYSKSLTLLFIKKDSLKIGISVSKKHGKAFLRNKIKRQVREMVTDIFEFEKTYDYVIVVKGNYLSYDFQTNKNRLKDLYGKLNPNKERTINE